MLTSQIVSNSIVIINFVLRTINMHLIAYIGYYTESEQTKVVKLAVFLSQFFNTGILLLLTNANTQETFLKMLPLSGQYHDLTSEWQTDIGASIVATMTFTAYWPIIEFSYVYAMLAFYRVLDRRFRLNKRFTACKSI